MSLLPFFPLNIVVYPGEPLNLHVFEPRYKDLLADCLSSDSNFVIPSYVMNKIEYGTEVKILEVVKKYSDGRADIKTEGQRAVKIESMNNPHEDKTYPAGEVSFLENIENGDYFAQEKLKESLIELFQLIGVDTKILSNDFKVFEIAHKIGLSKELEYELLTMTEERKRQRFILNHLNVIISKLKDVETAKSRIKMNGHFRKYDPLDF